MSITNPTAGTLPLVPPGAEGTSIPTGVLDQAGENLMVAAYTFAGDGQANTNRATLEGLAQLVQHELSRDLRDTSAASDKSKPSEETGELGFDNDYNSYGLTITMGLSSSGFSALGVDPASQPADLVAIPWDKLGDAPQIPASGDLVLQICSGDPYVNEHVVRRISTEMVNRLNVVYVLTGEQRHTDRDGQVSKAEGTALIGFLDGTSNLDPKDSPADHALVFVDPAAVAAYPKIPMPQPDGTYGPAGHGFPADLRQPPVSEPAWTANGTYMVIRASIINTPTWDQQPLGTQEAAIGRFKVSGAALDLADGPENLNLDPLFVTQAANAVVPVASHIRKANPRRDAEDASRRTFRRGYPLLGAIGSLSTGLVFICFGRSISTQFEFVFRAWMRNADFPTQGAGVDHLLGFESGVIAGGYYFAPPLKEANKAWTWSLPV